MIADLKKINKYYNGNHILKDVDFTVEDNDRIGLIGKNGCGKSTLLRILTGIEVPDKNPTDDGAVSITKSASIGFLQQNSGLDKTNTIILEMKSAFARLYSVYDEMKTLEQAMAAEISHESEEFNDISSEYARLSAYFEANEGYLIDVKIKTVLNGMGFAPERYDTVISALSGGEKTRLAIAKLLLENPNLLILDEPTNHLDFRTVQWLEDYLKDYKGALLIVSHDRYFLDRLVTSVAEIESGRLIRYKGNYTAFVKQKEMAVTRQLKEYELQQEKIAHMQEYVDKNLVRASTSKSAKSRIKALEHMELIEKPVLSEKEASMKFEYEIIPPKDVLTVEGVELAVGAERKVLCENVSFEIKRGEKTAIVGPNGIGKSTLLKVIQNKLPHLRGRIDWTKNIKISYFEQENAQLNLNNTVVEEIHGRYRFITEQEVRSILGRVRLTGENVFKKVSVISGGERAKLCFAIMMLERGNVLILDEPTNHLDLSSKEVLEKALDEYDGTVIFVSHDRYLLNRISTNIIEITENGTETFNCGFQEYMDIKKERELHESQKIQENKQKSLEKTAKTYRNKEQRSIDAQRKKRIKELEESIHQAEIEAAQLQDEMTLPEIYGDYQVMNEKCKEAENLKSFISDLTDEWMILCGNE